MAVNLNICAKCRGGKYSPSEMDKDGKMVVAPSVDCSVWGSLLLASSEVPKGCLYVLEQALTEEEAVRIDEAVKEEFYGETG